MKYAIRHYNEASEREEFVTDTCGEVLIFETAQDACAYADKFLSYDDTLQIVEVNSFYAAFQFLYTMLKWLRPKKMIELGFSLFSQLETTK